MRRAFFRRRLLGAALFERQKAEGQHDQRGMMVEAAPGAALEVIQAEFLFHLLVALFDLPAFMPQAHRFAGGRCPRASC